MSAPEQPGGHLYGQQPYSPFPPVAPMHPNANTSMIIGIVGLVSIAMVCGLGLFASPVAWHMGAKAVREIDANPQQWRGRSEANTGRITGMIGTILLFVLLIAIAFVIMSLVLTVRTSDQSATWNAGV